MANEQNAHLDLFLLLEDEGWDQFQEGLIQAIQSALNALPDDATTTTLEQEAERAASEIRALIPNPDSDSHKLRWFEDLWHTIILVASRIPHNHDQSQMLLIKTLQILQQSESPLWKDLSGFHGVLRDNWVDPTYEWHPEYDCLKLDQWLNLNSFVARLHGVGVLVHDSLPLWQLEQALEEDLATEAKGDCSDAEAIDNRVAVACEYLIHAADALLKASRFDDQHPLPERLWRSWAAGPLFAGGLGYSTQRWRFWERRLGELRSTVSDGLGPTLDRTLGSMRAASVAPVEK